MLNMEKHYKNKIIIIIIIILQQVYNRLRKLHTDPDCDNAAVCGNLTHTLNVTL